MKAQVRAALWVGLPVLVALVFGIRGCEHSPRRTGIVVDDEGAPLAGVQVTGWFLPVKPHDRPVVPEFEIETDGNGRFVLPHEALDLVVAAKPGYVPSSCPVGNRVLEGRWVEDPLRLTLERGATLTGRVLDAHGAPVADARVVQPWRGVPIWFAPVRTDAEGRFEFRGFRTDGGAPTECVILAPGAFPFAEDVLCPAAEVYTHEFVLRLDAVVSGRVLDLETGEPIADAALVPIPTGNERYPEAARTDADGRFALAGPGAASDLVAWEVRKEGYVPCRRDWAVRASLADGSTPWELGLVRGWTLEGVVTRDGRPIPHAALCVLPGDADEAWTPPVSWKVPEGLQIGHDATAARSAVDGRFRIEGLRPGGRCCLQVALPSGEVLLRDLEQFAPTAGTRRVDVALPARLADVFGRTTVNGRLARLGIDWRGDTWFGSRPGAGEGGGRYRLTGVVPGDVELRYTCGASFAPRVERLTIEPGTGVRHDVDAIVDTRVLKGCIRFVESTIFPNRPVAQHVEGGAGPSGVRIVADRVPDGARVEGVTDAGGAFLLALPEATGAEAWDAWNVRIEDARNPAEGRARNSGTEVLAGADGIVLTCYGS